MEGINDQCCPEFNPVPWNEKTHAWYNKKFISAAIPQFLYIPLPCSISCMMKRQIKLINKADAMPHADEYIFLNSSVSPWKSEYFIHVTTEVPGALNTEISGTFVTKVFDGPYNNVPRWKKQMDFFVNDLGYTVQRYFIYYTTCPKCAEKYGHNYIVFFAKV